MSLEDSFNKALGEWIVHCKSHEVQFSSSVQPVRDCDAYKKIVSMGKDALPFIRKTYDMDSEHNFALEIVKSQGLVQAVREIVGAEFKIPEEMRGVIDSMENYTKAWLDKNGFNN